MQLNRYKGTVSRMLTMIIRFVKKGQITRVSVFKAPPNVTMGDHGIVNKSRGCLLTGECRVFGEGH